MSPLFVKICLLFCNCLFWPVTILKAQDAGEERFNLTGKVLGTKDAPVSGANIQLVQQPGSKLVKVEVSGPDGTFLMQNLKPGEYQLAITHYDYMVYQSPALIIQKHTDVGSITLPERSHTLKEVAVAAKKPFIEQQFDKTVLNVENSITAAGNNSLEVLEKAPGVIIDQNDNISMRGRPGVMVMIDGKRVPLSGLELANILRSMPANTIQKIELITNPSAKYDAAGNAGIINILLKKDMRFGTNGSVNASFGRGKYSKIMSGAQLNHRNKKINIFGNYTYTNRREFVYLDLYRQFFQEEIFTGAYDQQNRFHTYVKSQNARLGTDYYLSPKTIIGVTASGNFAILGRYEKSLNKSLVLDNQQQPQSYFLTRPNIRRALPNGGVNINFKHTLDSIGRELTANLDYIKFITDDNQHYTTNYYNFSNEIIRPTYILQGGLAGELTIKSIKIDYSQPWAAINGTLEAGLKSSLVEAYNNLQFFNRSNGGNVLDPNTSNHFLYQENINAAYVNANKKWGKTSMQLGLRLENTNADGLQLTDGQEFDRRYTQLFPSGYIGHKLNKQNELGLSLSRRIDRPTYNQLNPFITFLDPSTYSAGNPFLMPELSYSFELTHTYKQKFVAKYSYSRTTNVIINVMLPAPNQEKVIFQTSSNLAQLDYYGLTLTAPAAVGKWLTSMNNGTFYYGLYRGNIADTNLNNGRPTFNLNSNNTIALGHNWAGEIIGTYRSPTVSGFLAIQPIWSVAAGLQKQLWNRQGNIKLNLTDAFYTSKTRATTALAGYTETFYQRRDSRVITLSFMYRFGNNQVTPARRRSDATEEEKRRAN